MINFSDSLKLFSEQTGLNQPQLAQLLNVHQPQISRWITGQVTPNADTIEGINLLLDAYRVRHGISIFTVTNAFLESLNFSDTVYKQVIEHNENTDTNGGRDYTHLLPVDTPLGKKIERLVFSAPLPTLPTLPTPPIKQETTDPLDPLDTLFT